MTNQTATPVKGPMKMVQQQAEQHHTEMKGEVKIDSPLIGKVEATNGIAYLVVGGIFLVALLFVYLKFRQPIHGKVKSAFRRKK